MSTITGYDGHRTLSIDGLAVDFTPTSKDGDGAVHVEGTFAGSIYVDIKYPYNPVSDNSSEVIRFIAQDPKTYQDVGRFDTQYEAIACLVDESRKHPFAPEDDSPMARCGDCDKAENDRYHVGEVDFRYWPEGLRSE